MSRLRRLRVRVSIDFVEPKNLPTEDSSGAASNPDSTPLGGSAIQRFNPDERLGASALPYSFSSRPRMHSDARFLSRKKARLLEAHVRPVNELVDAIRLEQGEFVPYVDPDSAGALARVLFVLESPAGPAALGSEMLSPDNDDATAANMWEAYRASGLPRNLAVHWNAVPWYVGDGGRERNVTNAQVTAGHRYLRQVLDIASDVEIIVAMGKPAQSSLHRLDGDLARRGIKLIDCIHPSPRNNARGGPAQVAAAFDEVLTELEHRS